MADPPPVVWFEGAVLSARADPRVETAAARNAAEAALASGNDQAARIACPIIDGQMLSETFLGIRDRLSTMADVSSATLLRADGQSIAVDLLQLLSSRTLSKDIALRDNDRILIPTLVATVSVTGAAISPGTFPFQPGRPAAYYIGLASGSDPLRNANGAYSLTSSMGSPRSDAEAVQPGDRIYLPENTAGITVSGALNNPGMFPFQPGYLASYYINRAGGIDPDRNQNGAFWVTDQAGKRQNTRDPLSAGYRIYVPTNAFGYNAVRYGPLITSVLALLMAAYPIFVSIYN
jgi:protein involved in polysaccharide export with SLBB domain